MSIEERLALGRLRIGIESGPVDVARFEKGSESEVSFYGTPVNIASRILGLAQPGEILLGTNAANLGGRLGQLGDPVASTYKHLSGKFFRYPIAF